MLRRNFLGILSGLPFLSFNSSDIIYYDIEAIEIKSEFSGVSVINEHGKIACPKRTAPDLKEISRVVMKINKEMNRYKYPKNCKITIFYYKKNGKYIYSVFGGSKIINYKTRYTNV